MRFINEVAGGKEVPFIRHLNCVIALTRERPIAYIRQSDVTEISETTISKINHAVGEALMLIPGEETVVLATVVSGYTELVSINPSHSGYIERLSTSMFKLAEFLMERGRHNLARQLILLRDDIRKNYT